MVHMAQPPSATPCIPAVLPLVSVVSPRIILSADSDVGCGLDVSDGPFFLPGEGLALIGSNLWQGGPGAGLNKGNIRAVNCPIYRYVFPEIARGYRLA